MYEHIVTASIYQSYAFLSIMKLSKGSAYNQLKKGQKYVMIYSIKSSITMKEKENNQADRQKDDG